MNVTSHTSILNVLHIEGDERVDVVPLASMSLCHLFHLFLDSLIYLVCVHIRLECRDVANCKMRQ